MEFISTGSDCHVKIDRVISRSWWREKKTYQHLNGLMFRTWSYFHKLNEYFPYNSASSSSLCPLHTLLLLLQPVIMLGMYWNYFGIGTRHIAVGVASHDLFVVCDPCRVYGSVRDNVPWMCFNILGTTKKGEVSSILYFFFIPHQIE